MIISFCDNDLFNLFKIGTNFGQFVITHLILIPSTRNWLNLGTSKTLAVSSRVFSVKNISFIFLLTAQ